MRVIFNALPAVLLGHLFMTGLARAAVDEDCFTGPEAVICDGTRPAAVRAADAAMEVAFAKRGWDSSCFVTSLFAGDSTGPAALSVRVAGGPGANCADFSKPSGRATRAKLSAVLPDLVRAIQGLPSRVQGQLLDLKELHLTNGAGTELTAKVTMKK